MSPIRLKLRPYSLKMFAQNLCLGLFLLFCISAANPSRPDEAPRGGRGPIDYKGPVRVIEADTVEIYPNGNQTGVGLIGIKSPPGNTSCGQEAIEFTRQLAKNGLYLAEDPDILFDKRNRRMYYGITRDNKKLASELVRAGLAHSAHEGKDKDELDAEDADAELKKIGCLHGGGKGNSSSQELTNQTGDALSASAGPASVTTAATATGLSGGFSQQVIAGGFSNATAFVFLPDGRMLVAEKHGIIKVVKNGTVLSTPFLDLSSKVNDYWDHGLIGLAADPNFSTNGFIYALYVYENDTNDYSGPKTSRLSRFTAVGDTASLSSERVILGTSVGSSCSPGADCLPSDDVSHTMGQVKFDSSGNIFLTTGDASSFNVVDDRALRAQDITSLAGKVLHISPLGAGLSSNPFATSDLSANQSKVWALGVRNAYRFNLRSGSYPYLGDVGWDTWEEINAATRGANLGWPCYEGTAQQPGYAPKPTCQALYAQGTSAVKSGVSTWSHFYAGLHVSSAATGGTFYTGGTYPSKYQGAYFYADYGQNWIRYVTVDTADNLVLGPFDFMFGGDGPVQVEQGPDGNLYYNAIGTGEIRRIVFNGPDNVAPTVVTLNPSANGTNVSLGAPVVATFSELLDPATITSNNVTLVQQSNGRPVAGTAIYNGTTQTVTFTPAAYLTANTTYLATVKGGSIGVKDLAGNPLASNQSWTFTTYTPQAPPNGTSDLSALTPLAASNGWGPIEINSSNGEQAAGDGSTISIRKTTFAKGLGVHAASDVHYFLGNACSALTATIGIDDEIAPNGSVVFQVFGDGAKLYESPVLTGSSAALAINVDVSGKSDLELAVTDAGDGNSFDHADWAIPRITCNGPSVTTISNVQSSVTSSSTTVISWTTNNAADSQVDYGATPAYGSSAPLNSTLVTSHSQQITGLAANSTYHFRVKSRDSGGTLVTSPDSTFTTPPAGSSTTYISDLTWTTVTNGWGPVEQDTSNGEEAAGDGHTISIRGAIYTKGLGVHAPSDVKYTLGGTCSTFISDIGIDDEIQPHGSVIFQVWGDGVKLYDSSVVNGNMAAKSLSVDIAGRNQIDLVVTDAGDGNSWDHADWAGARLVCGGAALPTATIASPSSTLTYKVGDTISLSGSGKDGSGNPIPASGLSWQVIIHHCPGGSCHTHAFLSTTGASGSFVVPDHGDESFFEIILTATESGGLKTNASVSIQPQTVQLTLATAPSGLQVVYGGTTYTAPVNITTVVGSAHTIQAPSPQGTSSFVSWSDNGAQQHNILLGASNLTITANFSSGSSNQPAAISVDFVGSGTPMAPAETAGVIPKSNWNPASGNNSAAPLNLVDESGKATGTTLTWTSDNNWSTPITDAPGNARMMKGYLDTGANHPTTISVSGLAPSSIGYDVYIYTDGDNGGATRSGTYSISGTGIATTSIGATDSSGANFNGTFVQANGRAGNYVNFSVQATAFTITATPGQTSDGTTRAAVNGIQIIPSAGTTAKPAVVSIDFVGGNTPMAAAESAGVVPSANWNPAAENARATPLSLVDANGKATGASVTWQSDNNWTTIITDSPGNARMMKGYLDTGTSNPSTVSVSGLPAAANGYDVYVYVDGDNSWVNRTATYSISGPGITTTSVVAIDAPNASFNGTFQEANGSAGNYVKFTVQATAFTITATLGQSSNSVVRAPLNGIQIVAR